MRDRSVRASEMKKVASGILPMLAINREANKAIHEQIYDAYRQAILDGSLRAGQRVPSTRALARELGTSRFPALAAYDQLLAEGYLESRGGSGTIVSSMSPEKFIQSDNCSRTNPAAHIERRPTAQRAGSPRSTDLVPWRQGIGAFRVGEIAFDQFPRQVWSRLAVRFAHTIDRSALCYSDHMGSEELREAISSYLRTARSVRCEPNQIMIVNGSQQGLDLSARVLLDEGSSVWVEEPGYGLAKAALAMNGCNLVPVPVDNEGLNVEAGIAMCRRARAAVVTPSHQFPLGVTMSAERRRQLLAWASKWKSWIIEDDYDSEYRYDHAPIASLQGADQNSRVIYIGTFSKVLFPSMRLGYIVIPVDLVDRFLEARRAMDLGAAIFPQRVVTEFIVGGHFARHIRRMRMLYRDRYMALAEALEHEVGDALEIVGSEAGLHMTVALRGRSDDVEIAERAAGNQLWLWPLSACYLGRAVRSGFILGFGGVTPVDMPRAARKLRNCLR